MTTTAMHATPSPAAAAPSRYVTDHPGIGGVLRAIMLKEMRQNLVLVALALVLTVIIGMLAEFFRSGFLSYNYYPINVLLFESVRSTIPLACAVAGLVLGVAQPLADLNFDRWAFLIHRPVPRSMLFWGRALAGLLLYFVIAGLPLIALIAYSLTPDGGRYFLWRFTLPPIADFFTGTVYYFAGLLIADRQARYYGSRVVPLILALATSFCVIMAASFWLAMICNLFFAALLAMAALGSAVSHGYTLKAPQWMRGAQVLTMLLAFSILLGIPATVALIGINESRDSGTEERQQWQSRSYTNYALLADGTYVKISGVDKRPFYDGPNSVANYTDMEGRPIAQPGEQTFEAAASVAPRDYLPRDKGGYRALERLVLETTFSQPPRFPGDPIRPPEDHWYFDTTRNRYYLYKYPPEHYQLAGTLGANGFVAAPVLAQPFEDPVADYDGLLTPHVLYELELQAAYLRPLFTAPAGEFIRGFRHVNRGTDAQPMEDRLYVLTDKHLYYLSRGGQTLVTLPIDRNVGDYLSVRYLPEKHWWALTYHAESGKEWPSSIDYHYEIYDDEGKLVSSRDLQNTYKVVTSSASPLATAKLAAWSAEEGAAGAACPLGLLSVGITRSLSAPFTNGPVSRLSALPAGVAGPGWIANLTFCGCLMMLVALMHPLTRFYRLERTWVWYLLALLTGPAALLTLFATQALPSRIRCPVCSTPRPLISPTCPTCHAAWPTPAQTGTEIFT